jgi:hypothetical protein
MLFPVLTLEAGLLSVLLDGFTVRYGVVTAGQVARVIIS